MRRKGLWIGVAAVCISALVTGCSTLDQVIGRDDWQSWTPTQTSIQFGQDGSVTETIFDHFNQTYYVADELQDLVARSVKEYDAEHGQDAITVPAYRAENGQIQLVLVYKSPEDYAAYNGLPCRNGSMLDIQMSGISFPDRFLETDGGKEVSSEMALARKDLSIAVTDPGHLVQVPGQIRYVSENARLVNSHVAAPKEEEREKSTEPEGLVLPSNAVYREPEEGPGEGQRESSQDQMVVIYERDPDPSA